MRPKITEVPVSFCKEFCCSYIGGKVIKCGRQITERDGLCAWTWREMEKEKARKVVKRKGRK
jgi:hypothetical protein